MSLVTAVVTGVVTPTVVAETEMESTPIPALISTPTFEQDFEILKFIALSYQGEYNKIEATIWKKIQPWFRNDAMKRFILNMVIKGVVHQFDQNDKKLKSSDEENKKDLVQSPKFNPNLKITSLEEAKISRSKFDYMSRRFPGNPMQETPMDFVYDLSKLNATIGGIVHSINCMQTPEYNIFLVDASTDTFTVRFYITGLHPVSLASI